MRRLATQVAVLAAIGSFAAGCSDSANQADSRSIWDSVGTPDEVLRQPLAGGLEGPLPSPSQASRSSYTFGDTTAQTVVAGTVVAAIPGRAFGPQGDALIAPQVPWNHQNDALITNRQARLVVEKVSTIAGADAGPGPIYINVPLAHGNTDLSQIEASLGRKGTPIIAYLVKDSYPDDAQFQDDVMRSGNEYFLIYDLILAQVAPGVVSAPIWQDPDFTTQYLPEVKNLNQLEAKLRKAVKAK